MNDLDKFDYAQQTFLINATGLHPNPQMDK